MIIDPNGNPHHWLKRTDQVIRRTAAMYSVVCEVDALEMTVTKPDPKALKEKLVHWHQMREVILLVLLGNNPKPWMN